MPSITISLSDEIYQRLLEIEEKTKKGKSEIVAELITNSGKK